MERVAVYECWCCQGRLSVKVGGRLLGPTRLPCRGWCTACGGSCMADARRIAVEHADPDVVAYRQPRASRPLW